MGITKISYRSKGYGQQAIRLILKHGFEFLGLERITANTLESNLGALKSLAKTGFILEGVERQAVYLNGKKYNRLNYAILKAEYSHI